MAAVGFSALACPASVAAGAPQDMSGFSNATVSIESIGTSTHQVQISLDFSNPPASASWQNEGAALTASGTLAITKPCAWVRINTTAFTSGTPIARLAGTTTTR